MTAYLLLAGVLVSGAVKGFCGKKTSGCTEGFGDAVTVNVIRFAICGIFGALVCMLKGVSPFSLSYVELPAALLSGATQAGFVTTWLLAVKKGAYTVTDGSDSAEYRMGVRFYIHSGGFEVLLSLRDYGFVREKNHRIQAFYAH